MIGSSIRLLSQLTRLDTCLIVFLCVAIPLFLVTGDFYDAALRALPLLTIAMCGFVINDIHDIEKDRLNHPERPLARNELSPFAASIIYFLLLGLSLVLVKALVDLSHVYLYLLLLIGLINYNYVVLHAPTLKNVYVAFVGTLPLFILASLVPQRAGYIFVIVSLFLFLLAREILMDIEDMAGDGETFSKAVGVRRAQWIAVSAKGIGDLALAIKVHEAWGAAILGIIVASDLFCIRLWRQGSRRQLVLLIMKLQLLAGIYFVL